MSGPYVNDSGDVWIERGSMPWPEAQHEARMLLEEMGCEPVWLYPMKFAGTERGVLVSDEYEAPCENAPNCTCCRLIDAWHWRADER